MKKFSQCLLCSYVYGRSCKLKNQRIEDEIYNNEIKCADFKSLNDETLDCDDSCCSENTRYLESIQKNKD